MGFLVKSRTFAFFRKRNVVRRFETGPFFLILGTLRLGFIVLNGRGVTSGRTNIANLRGCFLSFPPPLLSFRFRSRTLSGTLDSLGGCRLLRLPSSSAASGNWGDNRLNFLDLFDLPLLGWTLNRSFFRFFFLRSI